MAVQFSREQVEMMLRNMGPEGEALVVLPQSEHDALFACKEAAEELGQYLIDHYDYRVEAEQADHDGISDNFVLAKRLLDEARGTTPKPKPQPFGEVLKELMLQAARLTDGSVVECVGFEGHEVVVAAQVECGLSAALSSIVCNWRQAAVVDIACSDWRERASLILRFKQDEAGNMVVSVMKTREIPDFGPLVIAREEPVSETAVPLADTVLDAGRCPKCGGERHPLWLTAFEEWEGGIGPCLIFDCYECGYEERAQALDERANGDGNADHHN